MTLAKDLSHKTLAQICDHFALEEVKGEAGGAYLPLPCPIPGVPEGACRVFKGEQIPLMVYVGASLPMAGIDSHMIFAFTAPDSLVPHFTVDSIQMGDQYAFHLDLIPRVDLGANLAYMDAAFEPLTGLFTEAVSIDGLTPAHISPRQRALMSPWMLAFRANQSAFETVFGPVEQYCRYWAGLVDNGLDKAVVEDTNTTNLADRDTRNRAASFNPEVDPVWEKMTPMIGAENCVRLQTLLKGEIEI